MRNVAQRTQHTNVHPLLLTTSRVIVRGIIATKLVRVGHCTNKITVTLIQL